MLIRLWFCACVFGAGYFLFLSNAWRASDERIRAREHAATVREKRGEKFVGRRGTTIIHRALERERVRARRVLGLDRAENLKKRVKIR